TDVKHRAIELTDGRGVHGGTRPAASDDIPRIARGQHEIDALVGGADPAHTVPIPRVEPLDQPLEFRGIASLHQSVPRLMDVPRCALVMRAPRRLAVRGIRDGAIRSRWLLCSNASA